MIQSEADLPTYPKSHLQISNTTVVISRESIFRRICEITEVAADYPNMMILYRTESVVK